VSEEHYESDEERVYFTNVWRRDDFDTKEFGARWAARCKSCDGMIGANALADLGLAMESHIKLCKGQR
jgi:hypothetical protein